MLAALLGLALTGTAAAKSVRVFAVGPKFSLDWVDTRAHFHDKLLALTDSRLRSAPGTPMVQRGAGDVLSRLRGPSDRRRPVQTARDLITLPEDLGLVAAFGGSRGTLARSASDLTTSIVGLIAGYASVSGYYAARYPSLLLRPFPPTRLLALALTDTFVRTAVETFAEIADRSDAYVVAGVAMAQDWRVVCNSKASYRPPPGAGRCDVESPALVAVLRDPDEPARDYAYEATTDKPSTMALVFDPAGRLIDKTVKAYLTPTELPGQLDLVPGEVSGVKAIATPVGRIGIVTSKDAWMPDITAKLDADHTEILVQPEFFVNDTVRTTGPWAPDNIEGSGVSDVLRHPSIQALVLPQLVGNLFDFSADSQQVITVKPRSAAKTPMGSFVGQRPSSGFAAVGRYVVADPARPHEPMTERRARLGRAGEAMLPSSATVCADPAVAGPCRGGQVEDVLATDVEVGPPRRRTVTPKRHGPAPFAPSRRLAASRQAQRNVSVAMSGTQVVAAYEQADRVFVVRSGDAGRHWSTAVPVDRRSGDAQWWPSVSIRPDGSGYVAWQDGARVRLVVVRRPGSGRAVARLSKGFDVGFARGARQWRPSVALTAPGKAVVAWVDERARFTGDDLPQAGVYAARVEGATPGVPQRLDRTDAPDPLAATMDNAWAPSVAARGSKVLVSWTDFHTYMWNVEARESADGGATFGAERKVNDTPAGAEALQDTPRSAYLPGGHPVVAYTDWFKDDRSNVRPSRLYDTKLQGIGDAPFQVDHHRGDHVSTFAPALVIAGNSALVAWQDQAYGAGRIYLSRTTSAGTVGRARRVDDGGIDGAPRSRPAIGAGSGAAIVAWEDERGGPSQIYFTRTRTQRLR